MSTPSIDKQGYKWYHADIMRKPTDYIDIIATFVALVSWLGLLGLSLDIMTDGIEGIEWAIIGLLMSSAVVFYKQNKEIEELTSSLKWHKRDEE